MKKENQGFIVEATEEQGCRLTLKVDIKPEQVKKSYKEATKIINKEISIPGFRKGKAPEEVVVNKYASHIEPEWKELLINEAFRAALELIKIYPYNNKSVDKARIESCSLENGATIHLSYECFPNIPEIDFNAIHLPEIALKEISDADIAAVLLEIQKAHGTFEEVPDRTVELNDFIDLSIDKTDEEPVRSLVQERRFEVSDQMLPWLKKIVIGMKRGEVKEGVTEADPAAPPNVQANHKAIPVRVTLHGIKKVILPEMDDALAEKAGASSKEDLLAKIRKNLEQDAAWQQKDTEIRALEEILLADYPFEIPHSLVEMEVNDRTREAMQQLEEEGASKAFVEGEEENIRNESRKEAFNAIRLHFLFTKIGEREKISLSKEELNQKLSEEVMRNPYYLSVQKQDKELFGKLLNRLSHRMLFDKIREETVERIKSQRLEKA